MAPAPHSLLHNFPPKYTTYKKSRNLLPNYSRRRHPPSCTACQAPDNRNTDGGDPQQSRCPGDHPDRDPLVHCGIETTLNIYKKFNYIFFK